jgi:hypothetical protein
MGNHDVSLVAVAAPASSSRFVLRDLPFASRVVIAIFLMSVGVGYCSALVQLHFNGGAKPGQAIPGPDQAMEVYTGKRGPKPKSQIERLLEADETLKFHGTGQMREAFTRKSSGWSGALRGAKAKGDDAVQKLIDERDGERVALLEWVRGGAPEKAYKDDDFPLPETLKDQRISEEYVIKEDGMPRRVKIKTLIEERCACCHAPDAGRDRDAEKFRLDSHPGIAKYTTSGKASGGGMSLNKLAQTTHVHLLAFSMLYGLTGLLVSLTSYPGFIRLVVAPWALVMQLADISCWWLARLPSPEGELFGQAIAATGGLVAVGLLLQIGLTLFDLFGKAGKVIVIGLLLAGAGLAGLAYFQIIDPYLASEKATATQPE